MQLAAQFVDKVIDGNHRSSRSKPYPNDRIISETMLTTARVYRALLKWSSTKLNARRATMAAIATLMTGRMIYAV